MSPKQEPKYRATDGRIVNRASGETIPDDEPVFILRARDSTALATLIHYYTGHLSAGNDAHASAVLGRVRDFQRFIAEHPERMRFPADTAPAPEPQRSDCQKACDVDCSFPHCLKAGG